MNAHEKIHAALETLIKYAELQINEGWSCHPTLPSAVFMAKGRLGLLKTHTLVPNEPEDEMLAAGRSANVGPRSSAHGYIYKAMIQTAKGGDDEET